MGLRVLNRLIAAGVLGGAVSIAVAAPAAAALTATLSPASGPPGTAVTISGGGFDPQARVDIFFDTTDMARAFSNVSGAVSIAIQIPKSAQPGAHWISLDEVRTHGGAQAQFTVVANWPQRGYGPSGRSFNPLENTVDPSNADQLTVAWSRQLTNTTNVKPFVVVRGNIYVFDETGVVTALSPSGAVLWVATGGPSRVPQVAPAASNSAIFAGNSNGVVRAFPYLCRTDGGLCTTTLWVTNIGTAVNGLTLRNGLLYAPGQDSKVHVINSFTGALGASITPPFNASAAVTQPVAFAADGSMLIVQGSLVSETAPDSGGESFGGAISAPAVGNADTYFTIADGSLRQFFGWATPIGTAGCGVAPAVANGVVYAAGCTTIGAYDADTGAVLWSNTVPASPTGLAVGNGVLYACWGSRVKAYEARSGDKLGSGGLCSGAPEIVNGTLYSTFFGLNAATLDGATNTVAVPRPDLSQLRPDPTFDRQGTH